MFKENLKQLRILKNLTQQDLANAINVSMQTISHWESGYTEPSLAMLKILKDFLNVSFDELLE